jgi:hypothetical protein
VEDKELTPEEQRELLDLAEELSRCARASVAGVRALCIGEETLAQLVALVRKHRPIPYHYQGGRRYRGNVCIDPE